MSNYREFARFPVPKLMIDGTDILKDGAGTAFAAIQRDDRVKKMKYCEVYRRLPDLTWSPTPVTTVLQMAGAPKLKIWTNGVGVVIGSKADGTLCIEDIDGWIPLPDMHTLQTRVSELQAALATLAARVAAVAAVEA